MLQAKLEMEPSANGPMATTVAMGPLADGSISNFACNISNYLCTNFGIFIKKYTIDQLIHSTIGRYNNLTINYY